MRFYCLSEPGYGTSSWHGRIMSGIESEKRTKRFSVVEISSVKEASGAGKSDFIFLIGSDSAWLSSVIGGCGDLFGNRVIVLGNCESHTGWEDHSVVTTDVSRDVAMLYGYLSSCGKKRAALYGVNPLSSSDAYRKSAFMSCGGDIRDVFENRGDLEKCFADFEKSKEAYDGIICVNDYCAVSLIRRLEEKGVSVPFIVSCGETALARAFSPSITNLETNYPKFGEAGVQAARLLMKNGAVSSLVVRLSGRIVPGETTENIPADVSYERAENDISVSMGPDGFYSDAELDGMMRTEKLLNFAEESDRALLDLLLTGKTYAEAAEKLFMSTNGIKYRVKAMLEVCGVKNKAELCALVKKYVTPPIKRT